MKRFDLWMERRPYFSVKYEEAQRLGNEQTLPFWVADMDLPVAEPILEAIQKRAAHPYFGYTSTDPEFFSAFARWHEKRHGVAMDPSLLAPAQNVVQALEHILAIDYHEGGAVVVQPPVYFPFFSIIQKLGLRRLDNPLKLVSGRYEMDFDDLEEKLRREDVHHLILCSPHNPVGRVWTREELARLVELCDRYSVHILSDEIHSDLVHEGKHIPLHSLNDTARRITTSFYSSGKTFNLAALHAAYIYMRDENEKQKYLAFEEHWEVPLMQLFGMVANVSAFTECEEWYQDLLVYLRENIRLVRTFVQERLSPIRLIEPESTFLLWLDCRAMNLTQKELCDFFLKEANVLLSSGETFGDEGRGFMRMNIAAPRARLLEGLERIEKALYARQ